MALVCGLLVTFIAGLDAVPLEEARVSRVIQDVRLLQANAAPRPAALNDDVKQGSAVRTGNESRAELTFTDQTITRIGQNSVFSVKGGTREVSLDSGAMLLQVPHGGEPAQIRTAAVTASISGGTGLINANPGYPTKLLVMEGVGKLRSTKTGHCEEAHGGEMIMDLNGQITKPEKFNAKLVFTTSHLLIDFPPLANEFLFLQVFEEQADQSGANASPTPDRDEVDKTDQAISGGRTTAQSATPPDNGKFGPPSTITSPDPYVISSGTVINTDPTITTNGVTDPGKIYQGRDIDGVFSHWAFGSTSAFDTSSGFDDEIGSGSDPGGAGFKFSSLTVAGDPTINTAEGEDDLGLIGVNGINIDIVGTLSFAPIRGLLFATVNGPINLGGKTSFSGMRELTFYARGATSDLNNAAAMETGRRVRFYAERNINSGGFINTEIFGAVAGQDISINQNNSSAINAVTIRMFAGRDLNMGGLSSDETVIESRGDVDLLAHQNINSTGTISISRTSPIDISRTPNGDDEGSLSLNVTLNAEEDDLIVSPVFPIPDKGPPPINLTVHIDNSNFSLDSGANITLSAGGNIGVFGDVGLTTVNDNGFIGNGGNIQVNTGNEFQAQGVQAMISNLNGGSIGTGGNINFNIGGALTISNDAIFRIDLGDTGGATVTSGNDGETIDVSAASIYVQGNFRANVLYNNNPFASQGVVTIHADNNIMIGSDLDSWGAVSAGTLDLVGNINVGGTVSVPTDLTATGTITVMGSLFAINVSAVNDITAGNLATSKALLVNTLHTDNVLNMINLSQTGPVIASSFGDINFTPDPLVWTVDSIVTTGMVPFMSANGEDASPDFGNNNPGNGGHITLNINDGSLTIGSTGQINYITANGGNYNELSTAGGNAGTVNLNVSGDVTLNDGLDGAPAIATYTGQFPSGGVAPGGGLQTMGDGGTVDIQAGGEVTVNSTVIVSSNEVIGANTAPGFPIRRSSSGGDITIASSKTSGTAISVTSSAQLLSLLSNAAPGPGGTIRILASNPGNNANNESNIIIDNADVIVSGSTVTHINGEITAQRGIVEIRHEGGMGTIGISDANIYGDIVKIGALGMNGTLTIGGGFISAETSLKLYAGGSNGTIHFISPVTLTSNASMSILLAANTITIDQGADVTIAGDAGMARVYTDNPDYNFVPGPKYTGPPPNTDNGSFIGNGANNPEPLASAPPFDDVSAAGRRGRTVTNSSAGHSSSGQPTYRQVAVPQNGGIGRVRYQVPNDSTPRRP